MEAQGRLGTLLDREGCGWQAGLSITAAAIIVACASIFMLRLCASVHFPGGGRPCFQSCLASSEYCVAPGHSLLLSRGGTCHSCVLTFHPSLWLVALTLCPRPLQVEERRWVSLPLGGFASLLLAGVCSLPKGPGECLFPGKIVG